MWGSDVERQRLCRIQLLLWAYAYEVEDDPIVPDSKFDSKCLEVDPSVITGKYDDFFKNEFDPSTGSWVWSFPDIAGVARLYTRVTGKPHRPVHELNKKPTSGVPKTLGTPNFGTHFETMCYLSSLGFDVVNGALCNTGHGLIKYEFVPTEGVHMYGNDKHVYISYNEMFRK